MSTQGASGCVKKGGLLSHLGKWCSGRLRACEHGGLSRGPDLHQHSGIGFLLRSGITISERIHDRVDVPLAHIDDLGIGRSSRKNNC